MRFSFRAPVGISFHDSVVFWHLGIIEDRCDNLRAAFVGVDGVVGPAVRVGGGGSGRAGARPSRRSGRLAGGSARVGDRVGLAAEGIVDNAG